MALVVEYLNFSYTDRSLLSDICLSVSKGTIYALLGPSGCGKTTLFKLVIGLNKPKSGSIHIFGYPPGSDESGVPGHGIGYMPQDLCVQNDLTIQEILWYFGNILGMHRKDITYQTEYLLDLLQLPEKSRLIGNMSGGQRRRVSLAIAILHKPRLLVLDEPTVGVDPVLCEKIWSLLVSFSKIEKCTIILTTHYIEETRRANKIGFMRKGEILEENTPQGILHKYGAKNLEDAFLRITKAHINKKSITRKWKNRTVKCIEDPLPKMHLTKEQLFERKFVTVIQKVMIETRRNPYTMIFLFVLTFITSTLITHWLGQTPSNLSIAWVVDESRYNFDKLSTINLEDEKYKDSDIDRIRNVRQVENEEHEEYEEMDDDNWVPFIPEILRKSLDHEIINLKEYESFEKAQSDLKRNRIHGIIHLDRNFSHCYVECDPFLNLGQEFVDNETVSCGMIRYYLDPTNKIIADTLDYSIRDSLVKFQKEVATAVGVGPHVIEKPMDVIPIYGKIDKNDLFGVHDFIAPGCIYFLSYLFAYIPSLLAVVMEQGDEMYIRNYASGLTAVSMVTGKLISFFLFLSISNLINVFSAVYLLGLQSHGSFILVILLNWITTIVGALHGMIFANLIPDVMFCLSCVIGMAFNILWCGAILWNLESQPYYIRWLQYLLPWAPPAYSLRAIMAKKDAPFHPFIWPGFLSGLIWIIVSYTLCVYLMKIKK